MNYEQINLTRESIQLLYEIIKYSGAMDVSISVTYFLIEINNENNLLFRVFIWTKLDNILCSSVSYRLASNLWDTGSNLAMVLIFIPLNEFIKNAF